MANDGKMGFSYDIKFKPTSKVVLVTSNGAKNLEVVRVYTEHRSLISTACSMVSETNYLLSDGAVYPEKMVFASLEEFKQSV